MVHRFYAKPETAHMLTKESKKNHFYFRTLTRTDNTESVYCETTDPGLEYINDNDIDVSYQEPEQQPDKWEFVRITESGERYIGFTEENFYTDEEAKHQCDYLLGNMFDNASAVEAWRNGEYVCESSWEEK